MVLVLKLDLIDLTSARYWVGSQLNICMAVKVKMNFQQVCTLKKSRENREFNAPNRNGKTRKHCEWCRISGS